MYNQDVDENGASGRVGQSKKSGYQTEAGNNQLGGQAKGDEDSYKDDEIYINPKK